MAINGVNYQGKQTEYQYFPEEYFSGSDVSLYFEDAYMDDIQSLQFGLQEKVLPVYGYNSYTYDAAPRGQRLVQGSFIIAFKESGYMRRVLKHIADLKEKAKPAVAYYLSGSMKDKPKWAANVTETIDNLLNRQAGIKTNSIEVEKAPTWSDMSLGTKSSDVVEFTTWLQQDSNLSRFKGLYVIQGIPGAHTSTWKQGNRDSRLQAYKQRLNLYLYESGARLIAEPLNASSPQFDASMTHAVKQYQKHFSNSLAIDGILGPKTAALLASGQAVRGTYTGVEKLTVMLFQKENGLAVDGVLGAKTRTKMKVTVNVSQEQISNGAESDYAAYEADIWGGATNTDPDWKMAPHFYGYEGMKELRIGGFDIYINYGPLVHDLASNGSVSNTVSYNNTVRAIRGVQLTGVDQVISPTGEVIGERYTFIARDLD